MFDGNVDRTESRSGNTRLYDYIRNLPQQMIISIAFEWGESREFDGESAGVLVGAFQKKSENPNSRQTLLVLSERVFYLQEFRK